MSDLDPRSRSLQVKGQNRDGFSSSVLRQSQTTPPSGREIQKLNAAYSAVAEVFANRTRHPSALEYRSMGWRHSGLVIYTLLWSALIMELIRITVH